MPERIADGLKSAVEYAELLKALFFVALMVIGGAVLEIGKAMAMAEMPPLRVVIGRAIVTSAVSASAGIAYLFIGLPEHWGELVGVIALSALFGSLGAAKVEHVLVYILKRSGNGNGGK